MIYTRTLQALQKELQGRYEVASTIRHRGEKGRQREYGLAMFLKEYLPERYGVATGEVIPHSGDTPSPQCDIIVYDRNTCPVIGRFGTVQQVPVEGVYAVIEVKSQLTKPAIDDALAKFNVIRTLPRCSPSRRPRRGADTRPFFVLFGYELKTTEEACRDFLQNAIDEDLSIVALDAICSLWIERPEGDVLPVILNTVNPQTGTYDTLGLWFAALLDGLSQIDLGTPPYIKMITWE
jgi:hypothetical protein